MVNDVQNKTFLSNPDIQQRLLMLNGQQKNPKLELTREQENQIAQHFSKMFMALSIFNWCRGGTMGMAQQKALEQMSSFVKSKSNPAHPMNKYLHGLDNQYRREVSERIMKSEHSDKPIKLNPELAKKWADIVTKDFQTSLRFLNGMYKQYMPEKDITAKSFEDANQRAQQMLQQFLTQQRLNGRGV